jgi:predicted ATPase
MKQQFGTHRIVGREKELAALRDAYSNTRYSKSLQIVLMFGQSGVGKTTLVHHALSGMDYFCNAKCDRLRPLEPYSALVSLLCKFSIMFEHEYPALSIAPDDARILLNFVPDISPIVEYSEKHDTAISDLFLSPNHGTWKVQRFHEAIRTLLRSACSILKAPLIFSLDDIQWADIDSIEVIKALLKDPEIKGLLFVGTIRENEVKENITAHNFIDFVRSLVEPGKPDEPSNPNFVTEIFLRDLNALSVTDLISDLLSLKLQDAKKLNEILFPICNGNPFFTIQLLQHFNSKRYLHFSSESSSWIWNEDLMQLDQGLCKNIHDILTLKFNELPTATQFTLKLAACFGSEMDLLLLDKIRSIEVSNSAVHLDIYHVLDVAIKQQLLLINEEKSLVTFAHDRIQASIYNMIPPGRERVNLHLRIGRHLESLIPSLDTKVKNPLYFAIVDQLNRGRQQMQDENEKLKLVRLNLFVGEQAIKSGSFQLASNLLETGIEILGITRWKKQYRLTLEITNLLSSVVFSIGFMESCLCLVEEIYLHSKCLKDRYKAQILHVDVLVSLNRLEECIDFSFKTLISLGHPKIPAKPSVPYIIYCFLVATRLIGNKTDEFLTSIPICDDAKQLVIMKHLRALQPVVFMAGREMISPILTCRMIMISIRHGINEFTPYAFYGHGFALTALGDFDAAFRFAKLALRLSERFPHATAGIKAYVYGLLYHIRRPVGENLVPVLQGYEETFSVGDLLSAGEAGSIFAQVSFVSGVKLHDLTSTIKRIISRMNSLNQIHMCSVLLSLQRTVLELMDRPSDMTRINNELMDDESFEAYLGTGKSKMILFFFWMFTMQARFTLESYDSAIIFGKKCWNSRNIEGAFPFSAPYFFFAAITALEGWLQCRKVYFLRLHRRLKKQILLWSKKGNPNVVHLHLLLEVERLAYSLTHKVDAQKIRTLYDEAILTAVRGGFMHDAALASNRAARYYLTFKEDRQAGNHYLSQALSFYSEWGALAAVRLITARYNT